MGDGITVSNVLIRKLERYTRLSQVDRDACHALSCSRPRHYRAKEDVVREGDRPEFIYLILDGWAGRYKYLPDGRRQIVSFFLPGDICDINIFVLREMDHFVGALSRLKVAQITRGDFETATLDNPRLLQALYWDTLVATAIQREWALNLGQRSALERVAHLICEAFIRLRVAGRTVGNRCDWPITQIALAEASGLTPVHVSRTLQALAAQGLIEMENRTLHIPDLDALMQAGLFTAHYLHLDHEGRHIDSNEG